MKQLAVATFASETEAPGMASYQSSNEMITLTLVRWIEKQSSSAISLSARLKCRPYSAHLLNSVIRPETLQTVSEGSFILLWSFVEEAGIWDAEGQGLVGVSSTSPTGFVL